MLQEVKLIHIICLLLLGSMFSCRSEYKASLGPKEYINYFEDADNALRKRIEVGACTYEFQLKTPEYMVSKELMQINDKDAAQERLSRLNNTIWFNVYMSATKGGEHLLKKGARNLEEYNERLDYFLRLAEGNFSMKVGDISATSVGYVFENNHNLMPKDVMVIGFKLPEEIGSQNIELTYNDQLFNNGLLKVRYDKEKLKELPQLIL